MTATEIIYAIREKLKAYTDDTKYTDAYLFFLINLKRALYIRREYNQLQRVIDPEVTQTICMELEEAGESICPECYSGCVDCTVIRTVKKLPNVIELHNRNTITKIGSTGVFSRPINIVTMDRMPYVGEGKYESNAVFVALHSNGHLYLKSKSNIFRSLEFISVTALLENPDNAMEYQCPNGECYSPGESRYPVEAWMVDIIINEITSELANLKQIPEDDTNNAKEDN